tara:strand:+ start:2196 stop:2594 length:399 start_codon:yes stop_codon:yes gene_type:complete
MLSACATTEGYRQQTALFVGAHSDTLLLEMGSPVARDRLSDGGEVWTYYREEDHQSGGYNRPVTRSRTISWRDEHGEVHTEVESYTDYVYEPPRYWTTRCETRFVIDRAGIVSSFRFEGDGCVAPEIDEPTS